MKKALITIIIIGLVLLVAGKIIMEFTGKDNSMSINNEILSSDKNNEATVFSGNDIINKSFTEVKNINLKLGMYSVMIQSDDTINDVQVIAKKPIILVNDVDVDELIIDYKSGELTITQKQDKSKFNFNKFNFNENKGELLIKIPTDKKLEKIDIENGVGRIEINNIELDELDIECGTSSIVSSGLKTSSCHITGGTGSIKLNDILTDKIDIESGTGSIYVSGDIMKEATINTGTGAVELMINSKEKDYDYNIESGVGKIEINQNNYKREAKINNNSNRDIEINSGTGSVNIKTK